MKNICFNGWNNPIHFKITLKMKLTTFLLLFSLFNIQANSYSQNTKISLNHDQINIREVFKEIESKSEFRFLYKNKEIDLGRTIAIHIKKKKIYEILNLLFKDTHLVYEVLDNRQIVIKRKPPSTFEKENHVIIGQEVNEQMIIEGNILAGNGEPLPGANIIEKGTTNGVISDFEGNFSINVANENAVLVISYIGFYTKEVKASVSGSMAIVLKENAATLGEVVVIGYGTKLKKEVTGSVAQVSGEVLKASPSISVSASLAGRLPGVIINQRSGEPGKSAASILIRGRSTIGNNQPLIVVDGIANRDDISLLDPQDIESITVLKDASASIYGSQAASGVILVTTKRGVSGKPVISFTSNMGFVTPTRLPEPADSYTFASAWNELNATRGQSPTYTDEDLQKFKDGSSPLTHANTDWVDLMYKKLDYQTRHNLSVRGGSDAASYFLSLGSVNEGTLLNESDNGYSQENFRSNIDVNVTDKLSIGFDISGRKEKRQFSGGYSRGLWVGMRQAPTIPAIWPDGSFNKGTVGSGYNPLAIEKEGGYRRSETESFFGTLKFKWQLPIEGLFIDGFGAIDYSNNFNKYFEKPWNYSTYDIVTDTYETFPSPARSNISLYEFDIRNTSLTSNIKLNYSKLLGNHKISAFIAYEENRTNSNELAAGRWSFDTASLEMLSAGSSNSNEQSNSGKYSEFSRQNYFGRLSYTFQNKYLFDFNFRYDGSITFPEKQRFGFFPGGSLAWRLTEESFMDKLNFIEELKLRISYGRTGNDYINGGQFQYIQKFLLGNSYVFDKTDAVGVYPSGLPLSNLTWETTDILNFGVDVSFFEGAIDLGVDVFKNTTNGMLISRNLAFPDYVGFEPPKENAGKMENKGIEIALNYQHRFGQLGFSASGNFSYARNKILFIDEILIEDALYQAQTGNALGRRLVLDAAGFYKTQEDIDNIPYFEGLTPGIGDLMYTDANDDGIINSLDRISVDKNEIPEISFGLNLGIDYKNFDMSILLQGQARANQAVGYRFDGSGNVLQSQLENRVSPSNLDGVNPRAGRNENYWNYQQSTFWLRDASFLRLKTLEIGYNIPENALHTIGVKDLRLYLSGFNLFTISEIKGQDPEITSNEGTVYPQTKVYNVGVKITL